MLLKTGEERNKRKESDVVKKVSGRRGSVVTWSARRLVLLLENWATYILLQGAAEQQTEWVWFNIWKIVYYTNKDNWVINITLSWYVEPVQNKYLRYLIISLISGNI